MARRNVARVMTEKVQDGFCTDAEALEIAEMILHGNPHAMFGWRRG